MSTAAQLPAGPAKHPRACSPTHHTQQAVNMPTATSTQPTVTHRAQKHRRNQPSKQANWRTHAALLRQLPASGHKERRHSCASLPCGLLISSPLLTPGALCWGVQVVVRVRLAQNHARCCEAIANIATASAAAAAGGGGFEPVIAEEPPLVEKGEGMVGCCCCHRCGQRPLTVAMGGKASTHTRAAAQRQEQRGACHPLPSSTAAHCWVVRGCGAIKLGAVAALGATLAV